MSLLAVIEAGNLSKVRAEIINGADISQANKVGYSGLLIAIAYKFDEIATYLLDAGASPNTTDRTGQTALMWAAHDNRLEILNDLIARGADLESTDIRHQSRALHFAASGGHDAIARALLAAGAEPNPAESDGMTPLLWAAQFGHKAVLECLLAANVDATQSIKQGMTALHLAAEYGHEDVLHLLLAAGCNPNAAESDTAHRPLHWAAQFGHNALIVPLIAAGAEVNAADLEGRTALHLAAEYGHPTTVEALIQAEADLTARTQDGKSALDLAVEYRHATTAQLLREHGAA